MAVHFRFNIILGCRKVVVFGASGLFAFFAFLSLPSLLARSLEADRAKQEIRQYLKRQLGAENLAELSATGLRVPDNAMAVRWHRQYTRIDKLEFVSVAIGRLPYLPFSSRRMFVVKTVLRDFDRSEHTRYFSLSAGARFDEFFWVAEQSRWLWLLAF